MNKLLTLLTVALSVIFLPSCKHQTERKVDKTPKVQVRITSITHGYLPDYIEFTGKTIYLNKSSLVAPISGYVTKIAVEQGDMVSKGEVLFKIQAPEAYVMRHKANQKSNYGIINITAPATGQLVTLNIINKGVYANKGTTMCTILSSNDLKLQVEVPYEYNKYAKIGSACKIVLPDSSIINGSFVKMLPQINQNSQTIKVLAHIKDNKFIPENLIVKVLVDKTKEHKVQILNKQCLQTNALMTNFWVMKLINDSTAVSVPVQKGNQTHTQVEIIQPIFNTNDRIIYEGAYGLGDTVLVQVIK